MLNFNYLDKLEKEILTLPVNKQLILIAEEITKLISIYVDNSITILNNIIMFNKEPDILDHELYQYLIDNNINLDSYLNFDLNLLKKPYAFNSLNDSTDSLIVSDKEQIKQFSYIIEDNNLSNYVENLYTEDILNWVNILNEYVTDNFISYTELCIQVNLLSSSQIFIAILYGNYEIIKVTTEFYSSDFNIRKLI